LSRRAGPSPVTQSDGHGEQRETISQIPAPPSFLSGHMRRRRFAKQKNTEPIFAQVRQGLFSRFQYVRLRWQKARSCARSRHFEKQRARGGWVDHGLTRPRRLWLRQMGAKGEEQVSCLLVLVRVVGELRPPNGVNRLLAFVSRRVNEVPCGGHVCFVRGRSTAPQAGRVGGFPSCE
jgi:hypothetical protein